MEVVYDTSAVHPLDRYEHYRTGCGNELAPVSAHGQAPGHLLAAMTVARIGGVEIAKYTWSGDSPVACRRTERLIRAYDPECYRMYLVVSGALRVEQTDSQADLRGGDMALYDLSRPFEATDGIERGVMRGVLVSFPRSWLPIAPAKVRSVVGKVLPRSLSGRSLTAQLFIELAQTAELIGDPDLGEVLRECMVGLVGQRLGQHNGISSRTCRALHMARIRSIVRRYHSDPTLNIDRIASAANMSRRYLHRIFQDADVTPMQLLKRFRLEACYRSLQDPALAMTPVKDIIAAHGYRRPDQFARDFKQQFGISPTQARNVGRPAARQA
jgi:AraC-like DNA-binding protein